MKNIILFFCICITMSCSPSIEDISGIYVKTPSFNTIDTLYLYPNGTYKQVIYYKSGILYGINENTWSINKHKVNIFNLFLDFDSDLHDITKLKDGSFPESSLIPCLLSIKGNRIMLNYDIPVYYQKNQELK